MRRSVLLSVVFLAFGLAGCGDDVGSEEDAQRAYVGLDKSVDKAMQLGFQGFNAATSANIDPQVGNGDKTGTITVSGQVDQGASDNKTMNLNEQLKDYSDDDEITYNTGGDTLPLISLKLSKIPDGTLDGTFSGTFQMSGALEGDVTLTLTITGQLQATAADPTKVERKPETTRIVGTAGSEYGTYNVDVTR
jgi:hypothetical protein